MLTLIKKELRAQLPFIVFVIFLVFSSYLTEGFTETLTQTTTEALFIDWLKEDGTAFSILFGCLAMGITFGLYSREFDDKTITFLDGLPVTRFQLYCAKWLAAAFTLSLFPVLDALSVLAIRYFSRNSLDESFHVDWVAQALVLRCIQLYSFLAIGIVLSFFRRVGWLLLGFVIWVLVLFGRFFPDFQLQNLMVYSNPEFFGQQWIFPWRLVGLHLSITVIATAIGYSLFSGLGEWLFRVLGSSESRLKQFLLAGVSFLIVIVFVGLMVFISVDNAPPPSDEVRINYPSWATSRKNTKRFVATFPNNLSEKATELLNAADEDFQKVADFFDFAPEDQIVIDMTTTSNQHLGTAFWKKLNLNLAGHDSIEELRQTLGHESTHVVIETLADYQLSSSFDSIRFFHEGVATYVERSLFTEVPLVENRLTAAVLAKQKQAGFERVVDNDLLRLELDTNAVYTLGEVFAAATVRRFGNESLGKIARTFSDKRHTEGLSGLALWRSVFQASAYSLSEAVDEYYVVLEEAMEHHKDTLDQMDLLRPIPSWDEDGYLTIDLEESLPYEWEIVVRVRPSANADDVQYLVTPQEYFSIPKTFFVGQSAWYQIGYQRGEDFPCYQPWQRIAIP